MTVKACHITIIHSTHHLNTVITEINYQQF